MQKKNFLKVHKIAYETIITSFANGKISEIKSLLNKDVYNSFNDAIKERSIKAIKKMKQHLLELTLPKLKITIKAMIY